MKKLEKIPKNNVFKVPEGYFDQLPMAIQSRIDATKPAPAVVERPRIKLVLQYALPVVLLLVALVVLWPKADTADVEKMLASVSTQELIAYLEDSNLTTDELLEYYDFDEQSLEAIQNEVYLNFTLDSDELDQLVEEIDLAELELDLSKSTNTQK